jgi:phi13 family phage major tail protein
MALAQGKYRIGANHPCFKKQDAASGVVLGVLASATITPNRNKAEAYGNDRKQIELNVFQDATIVLETDDMTNEVEALLYGASTGTGGEILNNKNDVPPLGALAFYEAGYSKEQGAYYVGWYYPQAQATSTGHSATTKGSNTAFQNNSTTFTVFAPDDGVWEEKSEWFLGSEDDAIAWVEDKCGIV